jgi:hypothetical protein
VWCHVAHSDRGVRFRHHELALGQQKLLATTTPAPRWDGATSWLSIHEGVDHLVAKMGVTSAARRDIRQHAGVHGTGQLHHANIGGRVRLALAIVGGKPRALSWVPVADAVEQNIPEHSRALLVSVFAPYEAAGGKAAAKSVAGAISIR